MDWQGLLAVGTILLAIAALVSISIGRRQNQVILRQLSLQTGQQIPHLFIREVKFEDDTININIENATNVPAYWLGLSTNYYLVNERYSSDSEGKNEINRGESVKLHEEGKTVYMKYYPIIGSVVPKLKYEGKEAQINSAVSFFDPQGVSQYLPASTNIWVKAVPRFAISWKEKDVIQAYRGFAFNEFRSFLLKNNIFAVAVTMDLICKDSAEMQHNQGEVASFAILAGSDKTLAESGKRQQHFDFIAVPFFEMLSKDSWILTDTYLNTYSGWNVQNH